MADIYIGNVKGPQGDTGATGPQGAAGDAATIQVGTVSTTAYGNPAQVSNSGTEHEAVFNFVIPQGAPGATVTQLDNLALNTITTSTDQYPQIQVGDLGRVIFGKIIKFFQDLVTGLAAKVNYSDALTMEEIEASSDLTDKVSAAAASKSLKDALSTKSDWYYLLSNVTATTTASTHTLNNSRKLSDYRYLMFIMLDNSSAPLARCTMFLPRELYTNITGVTLSQVNSANQQFWIDIKRVSDTQLSIQSSSIANGYKVHVFGLYPVD